MIEKKEVVENTLGTLRNMMFEQMISLREGNCTANDAVAMSKMAHQVIDSYKVEIEAVKTANDLKDRNITFKNNLKALT